MPALTFNPADLGIAAFGLIAVTLALGNNRRARRWSPIIGLIGQPFWFLLAFQQHSGGLLIVSALWTLVYLRGVWAFWLSRDARWQRRTAAKRAAGWEYLRGKLQDGEIRLPTSFAETAPANVIAQARQLGKTHSICAQRQHEAMTRANAIGNAWQQSRNRGGRS